MSVSNIELIQHILVETTFIILHTRGKSKEDVINDEVLSQSAFLF